MISPSPGKATRLDLLNFQAPQTRAFHLAWLAFFVSFFAWFACAPLMPLIRRELDLTDAQVDNTNIAVVLATILVRLAVGPLCDRFGPRKTYTGLLAIGALPVFGVAASQSYESFLLFRLLLGGIGASFVITQYHTSVMFAPNVVGTANATTAGLGNAGGGGTQVVMPLVLSAVVWLGVEEAFGWRIALLTPGAMMLVCAWAYWRFTQDCPEGNYRELRAAGKGGLTGGGKKGDASSFKRAYSNYRVWMLFAIYAGCFGVELVVHNVAALFYVDRFGLSLPAAGAAAASFGVLAILLRPVGGWWSDRVARTGGLHARTGLLAVLLLGEGFALMAWAHAGNLVGSILALLVFAAFTHAACGATFGIVPFVDRKALGSVAGLVGAGGNVGAVGAGFLMKGVGDTGRTLFILGALVTLSAVCAVAIRFSDSERKEERQLFAGALAEQ